MLSNRSCSSLKTSGNSFIIYTSSFFYRFIVRYSMLFDYVNIVPQLRYTTMQINRHGAASVVLIGVIGNLLNIFVLNDRTFHDNPCTTYLWWSSASSVAFICSGLFTRVLEGFVVSIEMFMTFEVFLVMEFSGQIRIKSFAKCVFLF